MHKEQAKNKKVSRRIRGFQHFFQRSLQSAVPCAKSLAATSLVLFLVLFISACGKNATVESPLTIRNSTEDVAVSANINPNSTISTAPSDDIAGSSLDQSALVFTVKKPVFRFTNGHINLLAFSEILNAKGQAVSVELKGEVSAHPAVYAAAQDSTVKISEFKVTSIYGKSLVRRIVACVLVTGEQIPAASTSTP